MVRWVNGKLCGRQVFEKNPNIVKNFAVLIKYDSRTGTHAMYKEYRDVTVNGTPRPVFVVGAHTHGLVFVWRWWDVDPNAFVASTTHDAVLWPTSATHRANRVECKLICPFILTRLCDLGLD